MAFLPLLAQIHEGISYYLTKRYLGNQGREICEEKFCLTRRLICSREEAKQPLIQKSLHTYGKSQQL